MPGQWPLIVFPDVELWACQYLRRELDARPEAETENVYVGNVVPETRRSRMAVVRRDGGLRTGQTRDVARLTVRTWATSEQEVNDLSRLIAALLWAAPDGDPVIRCEQSAGPTPVADNSRQPLRLQSFELTVRGSSELPELPTVVPGYGYGPYGHGPYGGTG